MMGTRRPYRLLVSLLALGLLAITTTAYAGEPGLEVTYTGHVVHLYLEGTYAQYLIERAPGDTDSEEAYETLEFAETGCTAACTYDDYYLGFEEDYRYQIRVIMPDGTAQVFGPTFISIDKETGLSLNSRSVPNPMSTHTRINFQIPATIAQRGTVRSAVTILSPAGRIVKQLWTKDVAVGDYSIAWDGTDQRGRELPSGSYFYRIQAAEHSEIGRMILLH